MGKKELQMVKEEKNLGVIRPIYDKFKVSKQSLKAAIKGNQVLGMVWHSHSFVSRKMKLIISLFKSPVRPHLDYSRPIQAWRLHFIEDIEKDWKGTKEGDKDDCFTSA